MPWLTCTIGAAVCFLMMVFLGTPNWIRLIGWTAIGVLIYALYGYRHSALRKAANNVTAASPRTA